MIMKKRKGQSKNTPGKLATACCSPTQTTSKQSDPCCDQPEDGSSCCDKSTSKEINSVTTGCC